MGHSSSLSSTTIASPILSIVFFSKRFVFIRKQFFFVNTNDIFCSGHKGPATGILARLVELQAQLCREVQLVVDQVTDIDIRREHHLQTVTRRRDIDQHDTGLVLVGQSGISRSPDLPDIAIQVVVVGHHQSVQTDVTLNTPAALYCPFLTCLLVLHLFLRYLKGADEDHQRQLFLLPVVEGFVAIGQGSPRLADQLNSPGRPDQRPELF